MVPRSAYRRRLARESKIQKRLAIVAMIAISACAIPLLKPVAPLVQDAVSLGALRPVVVAAPTLRQAPPLAVEKKRRVYAYSIIPGGAGSRSELARVLKTDSVVAAHYASFDIAEAKVVMVTKPRAVHVSYRKGDKVYWTAKKVTLAQGETLLSDGTSEMRTRCANRISDVPQFPVEPHGPAEAELDASIEEGVGDAEVQAFSADIGDEAVDPGTFPKLQPFVYADKQSGAQESSAAAPAEALTFLRPTANGMSPLGSYTTLPRTPESGTGPGATPDAGQTGPALEPGIEKGTDTGSSELTPPDTPPGTPPGTPVPPRPGVPNADPGPVPDVPPALPPGQPGGTTPLQEVPKAGDVPEPGTLWLFGAAGAAMLLRRRKMRPMKVA